MEEIRRGDIYFAILDPVIGSEQGGTRPVLVLQNDVGNRFSPTTIVAAVTSRIRKGRLPTHVELPKERSHLDKDCVVLLEQLRTIDRRRLKQRVARLDEETMRRIDEALKVSLGLKSLGGIGFTDASGFIRWEGLRTGPKRLRGDRG